MKRLPTKAADGINDSPDVLPNTPAGWQDLPLSSTTTLSDPIVPTAATGGDGVGDNQSSHISVAATASGDGGSGNLYGIFAATSVPASAASTSPANAATDSLGAFTGSPDVGSADGGAASKSMEIVDHYGLTDLDAAVAINGSGTISASLLAFAAPIPAAYALDASNGSTSTGFNSASSLRRQCCVSDGVGRHSHSSNTCRPNCLVIAVRRRLSFNACSSSMCDRLRKVIESVAWLAYPDRNSRLTQTGKIARRV